MKKLISLIIITSMVLHCAGRLGFLNYLFEQRNEIALTLGIIDNIPITECSHEYYAGESLMDHDNAAQQNPFAAIHTYEVNLFSNSIAFDWRPADFSGCRPKQLAASEVSFYSNFLSRAFKPPRS